VVSHCLLMTIQCLVICVSTGCPFRHSDVDILQQKLQSLNVSGEAVSEVLFTTSVTVMSQLFTLITIIVIIIIISLV